MDLELIVEDPGFHVHLRSFAPLKSHRNLRDVMLSRPHQGSARLARGRPKRFRSHTFKSPHGARQLTRSHASSQASERSKEKATTTSTPPGGVQRAPRLRLRERCSEEESIVRACAVAWIRTTSALLNSHLTRRFIFEIRPCPSKTDVKQVLGTYKRAFKDLGHKLMPRRSCQPPRSLGRPHSPLRASSRAPPLRLRPRL